MASVTNCDYRWKSDLMEKILIHVSILEIFSQILTSNWRNSHTCLTCFSFLFNINSPVPWTILNSSKACGTFHISWFKNQFQLASSCHVTILSHSQNSYCTIWVFLLKYRNTVVAESCSTKTKLTTSLYTDNVPQTTYYKTSPLSVFEKCCPGVMCY